MNFSGSTFKHCCVYPSKPHAELIDGFIFHCLQHRIICIHISCITVNDKDFPSAIKIPINDMITCQEAEPYSD